MLNQTFCVFPDSGLVINYSTLTSQNMAALGLWKLCDMITSTILNNSYTKYDQKLQYIHGIHIDALDSKTVTENFSKYTAQNWEK